MGYKNEISNISWTDKPHNFFGLALNFTRYILTPDKLILRKGFFNIKQDEILLYRIVDKRIMWPLGERIFGCGTVIISAKDVYNPELKLSAIKNASKFSELLDELVNASRIKNNAVGREMYGTMGGHDCDGDGTNPVF